jgi:hypothetical protein
LIPVPLVAHTPPVLRALFSLSLLALVFPACGKDIGDECSTNIDCASDGTRDCDLSQPGGYCTMNGCDEKSCPDEAVCVRIFPYETPGSACSATQPCQAGDICLPDGFCVPRLAERRYCEKKCGGDGDCRGGYVCREAGLECRAAVVECRQPATPTYGSIALVADPSDSTVVRFCAPQPY